MKESAENKTLQKQEQGSENLFGAAHESHGPTSAFPDDRPESKQLKAIQSGVSASPQVQQFKAIQRMASQRGGTPSTGLSAQPANDRGLPAQLQAGLESLSGMDLSDVQVHRNSSKPAQVGALAYAQGNDIHLAAGQEHHLPHEAWHVVQQRQGRVQATTKAENGTPVNDDKGLEAEADVMGAKAAGIVRGASGELQKAGAAAPLLQKKAIAGHEVVQRMVTEVVPQKQKRTIDEKNIEVTVIGDLKIIGRPDKVFGSSMGDHTTAFAVHRIGLTQQLSGLTLAEARSKLEDIYFESLSLPGYTLKNNLPTKLRDRLDDASLETFELLQLDYDNPTAMAVSNFQKAINAYLEFRELIPLSTVDVSATGSSNRGKSKGESGFVNTIANHKANDTTDKDERTEAIKGLFDSHAVGVGLAHQGKTTSINILPGIKGDEDLTEMIANAAKQHINSMKISFPSAMGDGIDLDQLEKDLQKEVKDSLISEMGTHLLLQYQKMETILTQVLLYTNQLAIARVDESLMADEEFIEPRKSSFTSKKDHQEYKKELLDRKNDRIYNEKNLRVQNSTLIEQENYIKYLQTSHYDVCGKYYDAGNLMDIIDQLKDEIKDRSDLDRKEPKRNRKPPVLFSEENYDKKSPKKKVVKKKKYIDEKQDEKKQEDENLKIEDKMVVVEEQRLSEDEVAEAEEKNSPLGIQIDLKKDNVINGLEMKGRSPSPIIGKSMGSHTTAWVVHLDRIRKALIGKSLDVAIQVMDVELVPEAMTLDDDRAESKLFKFQSNNHEEEYEISKEKLEKSMGKEFKDALLSMIHLQQYINRLLTFINFIPGSTLDSSKTTGNAEGTKRQILNDFENGGKESKSSLTYAIWGMLDLKALENEEAKELLKEQHLELIKKTYPKSYEAAFEDMHTDDVKVDEKRSEKKRDRDEDEEYIDNKN